jgi:RNA polymerase sigma-70 factor (ECF subfamily)
MLLRARTRLEKSGVEVDELVEPADPDLRAVVDRYVTAFEAADVAALKELLVEDAVLEMPPVPLWFAGRDHYATFIAHMFALRGSDWRMLPTSANGQAAVGAYRRDAEGVYRAHSLQVFDGTASGIAQTVVFQDPELFPAFGLPAVCPDDRS